MMRPAEPGGCVRSPGGGQGLGEGLGDFKRGRISGWEDEKVLELEGGESCTTM